MLATTCWKLEPGRWALYTENFSLKKPAEALGLSLMGVYFRDGRAFALQFAGAEQKIKTLAKQETPLKASRPEQGFSKRCLICHETFFTQSRTTRFCPRCRDSRKREKGRERVRSFRLRNGNSLGYESPGCNAF